MPFQTTRVNYVWNVPEDVERGHHGHLLVHELCVCVAGAMTVVVEDYSGVKEMRISKPTEAAYIAPDTWITLKVSEPWHLS